MSLSFPLGRRQFIRGAVSTVAVTSLSGRDAIAQNAEAEPSFDALMAAPSIIEEQFGDPTDTLAERETLVIKDPSQQKAVGDDPIFEYKEAAELSKQMLAITREFVRDEVGRKNKSGLVLEFIELMDFTGLSTPFCAAGLCYAACRAYCDLKERRSYIDKIGDKARAKLFKSMLTTINEYYFFPSASVRVMKAAAIKSGRWVKREAVPKPGWLVVFSWDGTTAGNHIGMVEVAKAGETTITTLEYNTAVTIDGNQRDGGRVARKKRQLDKTVLGYINPGATPPKR